MSLSLDPVPPNEGGSTASGGATSTTVAPDAPGRLGSPVDVHEAFAYLRDLGVWRDRRKQELDGLDSAALASSERDSFSRDMLVSMALWKAISDRYDLLEVTFDSGRVGPAQAERLSTLIWGRLDVAPGSAAGAIAPSTSGALGLSLPEACRLSDAMTASLRARLSLEPSGAEVGIRVKDVRATVERIRDQISLVPSGADREAARQVLTRLEQRLLDVTDRAKRGADVGGLLAPLEYDAAGAERDLIVGAGQRLDDARDVERARQLRSELQARGEAITALVGECVAAVTPAPRLAVPGRARARRDTRRPRRRRHLPAAPRRGIPRPQPGAHGILARPSPSATRCTGMPVRSPPRPRLPALPTLTWTTCASASTRSLRRGPRTCPAREPCSRHTRPT